MKQLELLRWGRVSSAFVWMFLAVAFHPSDSVSPGNSTTSVTLPFYCRFCQCHYNEDSGQLSTNCSRKLFILPIDNRTKEYTLQRVRVPLKNRIFSYLRTIEVDFFDGLYDLEYLDLSNNFINTIAPGAFKDLHNLKTLLLEGNDFTTLQTSLKPGVFAGLSNLTVLTLHRCIQRQVTVASVVISETFIDLISLEYLSMDGSFRIQFDEGFRTLVNFKTLVMSGDRGTCEIQYFTNKTFYGLESLENLTVTNCEINSIHMETFTHLHNLRYLDLSKNINITMSGLANITYGLLFTNVTILRLNAIHNQYRAGSEILPSDMLHLRDLKLTELYMDENAIEYVEQGTFDNLMDSIKILSLRKNRLMFTLYMNSIIFNNPGIEILDATDQVITYRTYPSAKSRQRFKNIEGRKKVPRSIESGETERRDKRSAFWEGPVNISLRILKCTGSQSKTHFVEFEGTINNITYIDFSRNFVPVLKGNEFLGLQSLQFLNLSSNYIEQVYDRALFRELTQLQVLDLQNNLLGNELEVGEPMFTNLKNLLHLNMSLNRIHNMAEDSLRGLNKLETLDLSDNKLSDFDVDIADLNSVQEIDLSNNKIHILSDKTRGFLDRIAKTDEVRLDLSANDFACNCETIPFLRWLLESPVVFVNFDNYYCTLNNGSVRNLNATEWLVNALEEECRSYLTLIVGCTTGGSFLLAFIFSYSVYRNRWKLRYLYYMAKVKIDHHKDDNYDNHFEYDVFLSYADNDRAFVIKDMVERLEKDEGVRLCIRDRDFEIGEIVAVNISRAIRMSKKTMLVVSRHFLRSKWCNFEMNMAKMEAIHMKRKVIAVVFLEEVPANALPIELIDILRESPSTDLPEEENTKPAFWQTCLGFLKD